MEKPQTNPSSILTQADAIVTGQQKGAQGGVILTDGQLGAEASVNVDPGKPGGVSGGAWWQWMKDKGHSAAAFFRWTPK